MQLVSLTFAALLAFASHAVADQPKYCYVDKTNKVNNYKWNDVSAERKKHNIDSTGCCTTLLPAVSPTPHLSDKFFIGDLKDAIRQQVTKVGYFKTSTAEKWTCQFSMVTTAVKTRAIGDAFAEGLDRLSAGDPPPDPADVPPGVAAMLNFVGGIIGNALAAMNK